MVSDSLKTTNSRYGRKILGLDVSSLREKGTVTSILVPEMDIIQIFRQQDKVWFHSTNAILRVYPYS
jgi:hypothetical protein